MPSIQDRMLRAVKLDAQLYEEVEADKGAMGQATTVVLLSALAAGIGNFSNGGLLGIAGGALENPIVRNNSPASACVWGSASQRVPM